MRHLPKFCPLPAATRSAMRRWFLIAFTAMLTFANLSANSAEQANLLIQIGAIPLEGVEGRIDHLGFDSAQNRLFVAALGNNTVEVVDLHLDRVINRIKNLNAPQGIGFAPESNRLAVANDGDGSVRLYDGASLRQVSGIDLNDDADNVRYDSASHYLWVGYGNGGLAAIDPARGKQLADVKLGSHPESFQLEIRGKRVFVNLPSPGYVAVVDREKARLITRFPLHEAGANFPMALDEADRRLFLGCRKPAKLLVLDTETGKTVAAVDIVGDADDLFFDAAGKRIYVSGGEGKITVIKQTSADVYEVAGQVATAPGARTSFFVRKTRMLYVAVPHRGAQKAEIRVFQASAK